MKIFSHAIALASVAFIVNAAQAVEYGNVLADKSTLTFTSRQMGVAVQGRFPKFNARIAFDPAKPDAAKVEISVDLSAIDAGSKDANDEVVGKQWFNVKMFPTAVFTSSKVKASGTGRYEVSGPLTIKGKSVPVTATFSFKTEGANGVFDGSFAMKRIDFGVGEGEWADVSTVANEIQVNFHVIATPAAAPQAAAPAKSK